MAVDAAAMTSRPGPSLADALRDLLARGDHRAATQRLAQAHGTQLRRFLGRFFRDRRDAQDVEQEVWMAVQEALPRFEFAAEPKTWLFRIARHKIVDLRRRHRSWVPLESALVDRAEGQGGGPANESARQRLRPDVRLSLEARQLRVRAALDELSERDREVALLFLQGGLAAAEVASIVGLTEVNVRKIKSRVLERLLTAVRGETAG